jgi:hypothetical protein
MAEFERTRERERPPIQDNPYERTLKYRREQAERNAHGPIVIKKSERQVFMARQGRLRFFLDPGYYTDVPLLHWRVFTHEIRTKSGRHRHQGGLVIYVIIGKGYSVVDGERVDWQAGDLLLLPIKPGGVEHQHFNIDPGSDCRWIAFSYMPFFDHVASEFTQTEVSPLFKAQS